MENVNFPKIHNPKDFFLRHDGLSNLGYDLDFSIFRKYRCFANCKLCYIKNDWIEKNEFENYVPLAPPSQSAIEKLKEIFSYFEVVSIIDDLRYIKEKYPKFFKFYLDHQNLFYLSSMSDNAVFRHKGILLKEFRPIGIHEITFSEEFVNRLDIKLLLNTLDSIHQITKIKKLKLIVMTTTIPSQKMSELLIWAEANGVDIQKQFEFTREIETKLDQLNPNLLKYKDARTEESTVYTEDFGEVYPMHTDVLFLMNDGFYSELKSATTNTRSSAFLRRDQFQPIKFLFEVLKAKKNDYQMYVSKIQDKSNLYYKYFDSISKNLVVNEKFNFVPNLILKPYSRYYQKLVSNEYMIETPYGLLTANHEEQDGIVSIVDFNDGDFANINIEEVLK